MFARPARSLSCSTALPCLQRYDSILDFLSSFLSWHGIAGRDEVVREGKDGYIVAFGDALYRSLDAVERLKQQLHDARSQTRDAGDSSRRKLDQVVAEDKVLVKQKNELLLAFKKQLKLISVLRQQKMHVEAARLLSFTEEDFTAAMNT